MNGDGGIETHLSLLLDAVHFNTYQDLVKVITTISLDLANKEVNKMLYTYLYENHKEIFRSLCNEIVKKYPDAPRAHWYSYYGGLEGFFCGFSCGFGGPRIREHACSTLSGVYDLLTSHTITRTEGEKGNVLATILKNFHKLEEICFGPITSLHALMYESNCCFDDPPEDIQAVKALLQDLE